MVESPIEHIPVQIVLANVIMTSKR